MPQLYSDFSNTETVFPDVRTARSWVPLLSKSPPAISPLIEIEQSAEIDGPTAVLIDGCLATAISASSGNVFLLLTVLQPGARKLWNDSTDETFLLDLAG